MRGSWAGAMGHTQFIPTSYLAYAVDFTGDGRRDVWSDDPTDALASAANYLARSGWQPRPALGHGGAAARGLQLRQRRPVEPSARCADWRARGVTAVDGSPLPDHGPAAIIAPAGARGPAFAVYQNFFVIKRYNNATSYAMGVGHLGDRIAGRRPDPRRLAARRARAQPHREDRAAAAADRARLRHRRHRRGDRPEHHRRDPRLPGRRPA